MRLAEWLSGFKALHAKARSGDLAADERGSYLAAREELARALLVAQRLQAREGQSSRMTLRVSRALQLDLLVDGLKVRALTLDLSAGGFGALLAAPLEVGKRVSLSLRMPAGDPLEAHARVAGAIPQAGSARVAFAFEGLGPAQVERLEVVVFDTVLEQMKI